jgi:hypothetical protein
MQFIKKQGASIGCDGSASPCPTLLHSHACFFQGLERENRACRFGSLEKESLLSIWSNVEYLDFRKRVTTFDFSPCSACAGCAWAEADEEDCIGNRFPACGGCLWAQGFIQCP